MSAVCGWRVAKQATDRAALAGMQTGSAKCAQRKAWRSSS